MCGKKRGRRRKGDALRWNEEVKEAVSRTKDAHYLMCQNITDENRGKYKNIKK